MVIYIYFDLLLNITMVVLTVPAFVFIESNNIVIKWLNSGYKKYWEESLTKKDKTKLLDYLKNY